MEKHSFDRIIGGDSEQKDKVAEEAREQSAQSGEVLLKPKFWHLFRSEVIEATEKERGAIESAVDFVNQVAKKYGGQRVVTSKRVFILKPNTLRRKYLPPYNYFIQKSQLITVDTVSSHAILATTVAHELLHSASFQSRQILENGKDEVYRMGFEMNGRNGEGSFFGKINEALTAIFAEKFFDEVMSKEPQTAEDVYYTDRIKQWIEIYGKRNPNMKGRAEEIVSVIDGLYLLPDSKKVFETLDSPYKSDEEKLNYYFEVYGEMLENEILDKERSEEKKEFDSLLNLIIDKSGGKNINKQELFDEFAKAYFTGKYLPLARKIENILGKGSFRQLAEDFAEVETD